MAAPLAQPAPPLVGKITHHSVELQWEQALDDANSRNIHQKGDDRIRVAVQEQDSHGGWSGVYTGYAKNYTVENLDAWSQYCYRLRFMNHKGNSEWSPSVIVSTSREPLTSEHLHKAIFMENLDKLDSILESGDVNVDAPDKYGFSPLMQSAQKGYIDMIDSLVRHGADVNYVNEVGKTALMLAAYAGRLDSIKELRYNGASYDIQDRGGCTALHWAVDSGRLEVLDWMLEDGADLHAVDANGWTPIMRTGAMGGNSEVARQLIRKGADINRVDKDGKTMLMMAVINGFYALVSTLLQHDVDLNMKNEFGKNAYEMAQSMDKHHVVKILQEYMDSNKIPYK